MYNSVAARRVISFGDIQESWTLTFAFLKCMQAIKFTITFDGMHPLKRHVSIPDCCVTIIFGPHVYQLELITFEILAAERLRLMGFDNRLIIDCFANVVNILIWLFSTNDRLRSAKYESNYLENPFPEIKGVNLLSKTHRNDKSNLRPMTVLQE